MLAQEIYFLCLFASSSPFHSFFPAILVFGVYCFFCLRLTPSVSPSHLLPSRVLCSILVLKTLFFEDLNKREIFFPRVSECCYDYKEFKALGWADRPGDVSPLKSPINLLSRDAIEFRCLCDFQLETPQSTSQLLKATQPLDPSQAGTKWQKFQKRFCELFRAIKLFFQTFLLYLLFSLSAGKIVLI